jgi:hypothetical protein
MEILGKACSDEEACWFCDGKEKLHAIGCTWGSGQMGRSQYARSDGLCARK